MRSVTLAGLCVCALVAVRIAAVTLATRAQTHAVHAGEQIVQVLDVSQLAEREAVDLETGVRGYAATGDRVFLAPWSTAYRDLPVEMRRLQVLASTRPAQARAAAELARQVRAYATGYTLPFVNRATPPRGQALLRYLERGKALLDAVRARFYAFDAGLRRAQRDSDGVASAADGRFEASTMAAGGLVVAAVLGLVALLFWRVVLPLRQLIEACADVARGDRRVRLPEVGPKELVELKRAFNAMVDELDERDAKLEARATELREALARTEAVIETAHNAFVSIDDRGTITAWNPGAERIFGRRKAQALGRPLAELIIPRRFRDEHQAGLARHLAGGPARVLGKRLELPALRADGTEFPAEITIALASSSGRPTFHAFIADLSERRAGEFKIRLLASVVDGSQDAIISKDADGVVTSWNRGAERLYGYTAQEMIGRSIGVLVPPERAGEDQRVLSAAMSSHSVQQLDTVRMRRDGSQVEVSVTISPIWSDGQVIGASAIARDITDRRAAERVLQERERQLAEAQALTHMGSWEWDIRSPAGTFSDELCRIAGRKPGWSPTAEEFIAVIHPEDRRSLQEYVADLRDGELHRYEYRVVRPDNEIRHVVGHSRARLDGHGQVTHMHGTVQDVTEQWKAEEERRKAQERFERAFADAPIGMGLVALDGRWLRVNQALAEIVGREPDELRGLTFQDVSHPGDHALGADMMRRLVTGELDRCRFEKRYLHPDGDERRVQVAVSMVRDRDGLPLHFVSQVEDITARREAEEALRASESRFASIVANVPGMVYRFAQAPDGTSTVRWASEGARELYGISPDELMADAGLVLEGVHPEEREAFARSVADSAATMERWDWHGRHVLADGTLRHLHASAQPFREDDGTVVWDGVIYDETEVMAAHEREAEARRRLQLVLDNLPGSGVTLYDPDTRLVFCEGPLFAKLDTSSMIGRPLHENARPHIAQILAPGVAAALEGRTSTAVLEDPVVGVPLAVAMAPYREAGGEITGTLVHWHDISALRAAQSEAQAAQEHFRHAFDAAPIGMALLSPQGTIERVNAALRGIVDHISSDLEGRGLGAFMHPSDRDRGSDALERSCAGEGEAITTELRLIRAAGPPVDVSLHATPLRDADGAITHVLCQLQDVTERKRYESQLQFMADHDPLTGLLNRRKFEAELDRHVAQVKRYGAEGALIALDVDHFKQVNDTLGHNAGDQLIVSIAGVLRGVLRESDVLARLGGDEFAVLLPKANAGEARRVAGKIVEAVRTKTTLLDGEAKRVTASVGVAMFEAHDLEVLTGESILVEADLAMYDAKEAGRDGCAFYTTSEHDDVSRTEARLTWVARIEHALANDRFALVAQPILDLHSGQIRQHELLIRMLDDRDELVPPATFLYIAERFGLMGRIDEWVVTRAIALLEQRPDWQLEVNISGRSLGDLRLLGAMEQRLALSTIDPSRLILEVTETAAVANITQAQAFAQRLRDLGCRFALDDFGAGFGSFYYLKHLPFDYVKIDGEFVQHVVNGHIDRLVIEAVVRIASGLGKETIAEFVTDEKTQRMVARLGVDYAQGHHIGMPMPVETVLAGEAEPDARRG